jgi:hypothetical protein
MSTQIMAPFSREQVINLNNFQTKSGMHPFTCGGDRGDEAHQAYADTWGGEPGQLVAYLSGWKCPVCDYRQDWAHGFMADGSWRRVVTV